MAGSPGAPYAARRPSVPTVEIGPTPYPGLGSAPDDLLTPESDNTSRSARAVRRYAEKGGDMSGWQIFAWVAVAAISILRVALVIGILAVVVAIVRGVRAMGPVSSPG